MSTETTPGTENGQTGGERAAQEMLTVTDSRTGRSYEIPINDGTVRATDLRQIKVDPDEFGLMAETLPVDPDSASETEDET